MSSKLDEHKNLKINSGSSELEKIYNPLEHNASIQQEIWIQKEVSYFLQTFLSFYIV